MSASSSALGEAAFAALPKTLRAKIDDAFTSISLSNPPHRQTHSETHSSLTPAAPALGGGGGGFILEDTVIETEAQGATTTNASARIPLASIPAALQLLDLPPHDRQILTVFRDAAESESEDEDDAAEYGVNGANGKEMSVSRSQWRAVCAVLLEGSSDPSPSPSSPSPSPSSHPSHPSPSSPPRQREEHSTRPRRSKAAYTPISPSNRTDATYESGDDSEPYVASDDSDHSLQQGKDQYDDDEEEDGDDSDYEYTSKPSKSTKSTNKSKSRSKANANANANAPPDHAAALAAFALFFPSFPSTPATPRDPTPRDPTPRDPTELKDNSNELKDRKITLRDLQAAMKRAGEKYKADDLTEMLALFSTSPDTSNPVSFADFGRIMRAAGLA